MEEKEQKMNFFKRFYMSIFKLEDFPKIFAEKVSKSVGYFAVLILITVLILNFFNIMQFSKMFKKGFEFIKTLPDFKYENGALPDNLYASGFDEEYNVFFIMDTSKDFKEVKEVTDFADKEYGNNYLDADVSILSYKTEMFVNYYGTQMLINYNDVLTEQNITEFELKELIKDVEDFGLNNINIVYYLYFTVFEFIALFTSLLLDAIMLAIFASIAALMICRVDLKFKQGLVMACHVMTLPIVITLIYNLANILTGFYMEYFSYMILIIEYIYVVAVIFMLKSDKQKMEEELAKVEAARKEVASEIAKENVEENEIVTTLDENENTEKNDTENQIESNIETDTENKNEVEKQEEKIEENKDSTDENNNDLDEEDKKV